MSAQPPAPAVPIQVPSPILSLLPALPSATPAGGGTPTRPALEGALRYTRQWLVDNPTRQPLVVLVTSGQHAECGSTVANVADVAAAGLAASPSVRTFLIGVGGSLDSLQTIATAGGGQAILVDAASGDLEQRVLGAFNAIRDSVTTKTTDVVIETITETLPVPCQCPGARLQPDVRDDPGAHPARVDLMFGCATLPATVR